MSELGVSSVDELQRLHRIDEFNVIERIFTADTKNASVGLANIHPVVPDLEGNKDKIRRALEIFKRRRVNLVLFPEFCLSGYFWDDKQACRKYMATATLENNLDWIESVIRPMLDDRLREVVLNGLTAGPDGMFYNTTLLITAEQRGIDESCTYQKVFLPGIEKEFTLSGGDNRLVGEGQLGRFGFTTCYDYLFSDLLREYAFQDGVDAIIQVASWRAQATRDYPGMNVRTDLYYGRLWDMTMAASSAMHQVWTIACNAVGRHEISGVSFWGGSGIWAPSGMNLVQASNINEELLIVHNLDIKGQRKIETDDIHYAIDFREIYRPIRGDSAVTRMD